MNYIGKVFSNFKEFYNEINAATLTGAIDVVVVKQEDGSFHCSPFHVRFGKIGVMRSREKVVDIEINGETVDIHMKLGENGEAFFVQELEDGMEISSHLGTSPLPPFFFHGEGELADQFSHLDDSDIQHEGLNSLHLSQEKLQLLTDTDDIRKQIELKSLVQGDGNDVLSHTEFGESASLVRTEIPPQWKDFSGSLTDNCSHGEAQTEMVVDTTGKELGGGSIDVEETQPLLDAVGLAKTRLLDDNMQGSKTDNEEPGRGNSKNVRRKRKRRQNGKKLRPRQHGSSQSSDNSTTSERGDVASVNHNSEPQEEVFPIDDLDSDVFKPSPVSGLLQERSKAEVLDDWEGAMSRSMGPDFYPFSDTDISPPPSPCNSRPTTPIKSDTEFEVERQKSENNNDVTSQTDATAKWSWTWGELPTPPSMGPTSRVAKLEPQDAQTALTEVEAGQVAKQEAEDKRSLLGGMFSFMRATKKARHNPQVAEGIYLDDLNVEELDPEIAALYFPKTSKGGMESGGFQSIADAKDEDLESGNGPSLPQSPHSVEGAVGGPRMGNDSDFEDFRHPIFDYKGFHDVAFSLCGRLHEYTDGHLPEELFLQSLVTYDDFFISGDALMEDPNLVVRLDGKFFNWASAAQQVLSLVLFQRPLPQCRIEDICKEHMPKKEIRQRTQSRGYSWFWPRRIQPEQEDLGTPEVATKVEETSQSVTPQKVGEESAMNSIAVTVTGTQTTPTGSPSKVGGEGVKLELNDTSESDGEDNGTTKNLGERFKKSLRLTSEEIRKLNLREGSNEAVFSVTTAYQGTTRCKCHIFLWHHDDKIVVSDIDGTITKSDVLGHILPIIGKDWAQGGVADLFTKIRGNGYNFLYLSARAIGQARITRDYLRSVKQGNLSLPDGPLLLNPTSLVQAFHREVIEKKPEEFKISCLRDIQALYPSDQNPFYAGYGNRINDTWAYRAVGIPISRIFTINHKGELKHELTETFQSSYENLSDIVHQMFPPAAHVETMGEFSMMQYWRPPLPDYSDEIETLVSSFTVVNKRKKK